MKASGDAAVWVLLGPHRGDNNQVLALADAVGLPYRTIEMRYRWFAHLPAVCRTATIRQLQGDAQLEIAPPWPSLVLGIGQRSAPVARFIQKASGGRAKIVRLGDPMVSHKLFDLVITTTQYAVRDGKNVVRLPITITSQDSDRPTALERRWLEAFPHPRRLIVIGGKTSLWRFDTDVVRKAVTALQRKARSEGGSVIAVTSPRTGANVVAAARDALGEKAVVSGPFPTYGALLHTADEIHVTGDSVSMLSDAIATGKPVGLIPLQRDLLNELLRWTGDMRGQPFRLRDLEKFWADLRARGLVGTVEAPRCGKLDISPTDIAVDAVLALTQRPLPVRRAVETTSLSVPEPIAL
jgi:mitochondrial fission protein ELM1